MLANRPGLRIALFFSAGIVVAQIPGLFRIEMLFIPGIILLLILARKIFSAGGKFAIKKSNISIQLLLALLIFSIGFIRMSITKQEFLPQTHLINLNLFDSLAQVRGWITDKSEYTNGSTKLTVAIISITVRGMQYTHVDGKISIKLPYPVKGYGYGDEITASGILYRPSSRRNPGELDYGDYLERKGIYAQLRAPEGANIEMHSAGHGNVIMREIVEPVRELLSGAFARFHTGQELEFLRAIVLGQRSGIDPEVLDDFRDTGTLHILAVSGLHVGFVVLIVQVVLSFLLVPKRWTPPVIIAAILLYILVTGARPPVMRAGVFLIIYNLGMMTQKWRDALNILGSTSVIVLLINPRELFDPGFQLSFCAVIGIIYFTRKVSPLLFKSSDHKSTSGGKGMPQQFSIRWWGNNVRSLFIMSAGAFFGTALVMAYHFHRLAPGGIFLSILFVPAAALVVGLGFAEIVFGSLFTGVGTVLSSTNDALIQIMFRANRLFTGVPGVNFTVGHHEIIWVVFLIIFVIITVPIFSSMPNHKYKIIFSIAVVMIIWGSWWTQPDGLMRVTFLDVGQGDAAVISFPDGTHWLVDGGDKWESSDAGENHVVPYMRWAGIRGLNGVILSHPNRDHYGGLPSVLKYAAVDTLYEGIDSRFFSLAPELNAAALERNTGRRLIIRGDKIGYNALWRMYVLSPLIESQDAIDMNNLNEYSVALFIIYGKTKFLFTGDIGAAVEKELTQKYGSFLNSDVIKVAHHGSKYSSDSEFLRTVMPEYAVISAGRFNSFGHPTTETLDRLNALLVQVFRTDVSGAVSFISDGEKIQVVQQQKH